MSAPGTLETDLSTTPAEPRRRRGGLTDDEILLRYGPTIWDALVAFGVDPGYFEAICETAYMVEHKRRVWDAKNGR